MSAIVVSSFDAIAPRAKPQQQYQKMATLCGCFGVRHRLTGSCVLCGRIACEAEAKADATAPSSSSAVVLCGCPTCGNAVVSPLTADQVSSLPGVDAATVEAYKQKDKLLTFDREHAKRTHVNDAQSDYYESSTWLSDAEKADLDRKEQLRRDAAKPSNRRYKMSFDLAGRRVVEVIQGDEEEQPDLATFAAGVEGGKGAYDAGYEPDQLLQNESLMSENAGRIG